MSVSYGGDSITFADSSTISSGWTGFKNRIINGDMKVDQRNAGASVSTPAGGAGGVFAVDRFKTYAGAGTTILTSQQVSDGPNGFTTSLKTTVNTSGTATETGIYQYIEGYNTADLKFGTNQASPLTISFWVKSSVTGTYAFVLRTTSGARSYLTTYTINATDTWEYKTISIPPETSGTINTVNSYSLIVQFSLGGTNSPSSSTNTWLSTNTYNISGTVQFSSQTVGSSFYITGVQVEKGSTASSFEYRPYPVELMMCQRYYSIVGSLSFTFDYPQSGGGLYSGNSYRAARYFKLPVTMRTDPSTTVTYSSSGWTAAETNGASSSTGAWGSDMVYWMTPYGSTGGSNPYVYSLKFVCSAEF